MKCPSCSAELSDTAKFCPECGEKIVRKTVCPDCGTEVAPGSKFCAECGHKFAAAAPAKPGKAAAPRKKPAAPKKAAGPDPAAVQAAVDRVFGEFLRHNVGSASPKDAAVVAKAAEAGHPRAMFLMGELLSCPEGEGVAGFARDIPACVSWYRKSAEAGDGWGMMGLSSVYADTESAESAENGVEPDFDEADRLLEKAKGLIDEPIRLGQSMIVALGRATYGLGEDDTPDFSETIERGRALVRLTDGKKPDELPELVRLAVGAACGLLAGQAAETADEARELFARGAAMGNEDCAKALDEMDGGADDGADGGDEGAGGETLPDYEDRTVQKGDHYAQTGRCCAIALENGRFDARKEDFRLRFDSIENQSSWVSGSLRIALWFTKEEYKGGGISGTKMGEADLAPLEWLNPGPDNALSDYDANIPFTGDPPTGEYFKTVVATELHEDGNWYIVGSTNFGKKFPWTHGMAKNYLVAKNGYSLMIGGASEVALSGVSWQISGGRATIQADRVENLSPWNTGSLKLVLWYCKEQYSGEGSINGIQMAEGLISKESLRRGNHFPDVSVTGFVTGNPAAGDYWSVVTVNECHADGAWYIVGHMNFRTQNHWTR